MAGFSEAGSEIIAGIGSQKRKHYYSFCFPKLGLIAGIMREVTSFYDSPPSL